MNRLIAWLGRGISALLFFGPRFIRVGLGYFLAFLWFDLFRIRRNVVMQNLEIAYPGMDPAEKARIGRASVRTLGVNLVEYAFMPFLNRKNYERFFEFHGTELLEQAYLKGKGVLLLTAHLGHGDLGCAALSLRGYKLVMVSKFFKWKWLNDVWFGMREKLGTRFVAPRDSSYALLRALKNNAAVVIPLDQFTGPPIGVKTKFFGHETGTGAGLAVMAQRSGAPVIAVYTYRKPDGKHSIHFTREIPVDYERDDQAGLTRVTQEFNDELEKFVRLHPDQWMWIHRRWKRFVV